MNLDMLKILAAQFGIDGAAIDGILKAGMTAGEKIEGFDARLANIERLLSLILARLGVNDAGAVIEGQAERVNDGKH